MSVLMQRCELQAILKIVEQGGKSRFCLVSERGYSGIVISHEGRDFRTFETIYAELFATEGGCGVTIQVAKERDATAAEAAGVMCRIREPIPSVYHVFLGAKDKGAWLDADFFEIGQRVIITGYERVLSLYLNTYTTTKPENRDEEEFGPE